MAFLTDSGLDNFGTNPISYGAWPATSNSYVNYLAVASGSITPSTTTTSVVSQVGNRSYSDGGFVESENSTTESNRIKDTLTFRRVIDFTADQNLTHWGLFTNSSGGNVSFVDLFRTDPNDSGSSAITLSMQSGDQLQMTFAHITYLDPFLPTTATMDIDNNGTATTPPGKKTWFAGGSFAYSYAFLAFLGSGEFRLYSSITDSVSDTGTSLAYKSGTGPSYTPGNYYKEKEVTFSTSEGNGSIKGFGFAYSSHGGFKFVLDTSITKASTETLKLTFRSSWARDV